MEIRPVEEILSNAQPTLALVALRALQPDRDPYFAMLLQPTGMVEANDLRVGHADAEEGKGVCSGFLAEVVQKKADLAVTPEYCTPWTVTEDILNGTYRPEVGAIWVLGCESITPAELKTFGEKANEAGGIWFHHEPFVDRELTQKRYIDPLLYVFWGQQADDNLILCMLVQFKTTPCKDFRDVEQRSLYLGNNIYIFNQGLNKIGLLTIICSDAFDFTEHVDNYHANCLLIHIQLNPKPAHKDYAQYRMRLSSVGSGRDVELLCLNWAQNIHEIKPASKPTNWENVAGSAWYVPPAKFSADSQWIDDLHKNGVYYSVLDKRWHSFFLNYEGHAILLQKQKLLYLDPQAIVPKTCMKVLERWTWSVLAQAWEAGIVANDGFAGGLGAYGDIQGPLPMLCQVSPLAVERALEALSGPKGGATSWHTTSELEALHLDEEESFRRVTVHQNAGEASRGAEFRRARLQRAQDAVTLPGKGVPWPLSLRDLEKGFRFDWSANNPHHNIRPAEGTRGAAALVYLGEQADLSVVAKTHQKLSEGLYKHAIEDAGKQNIDVREALVRSQDRLCVVFRRDHQFRTHGPDGLNDITEPVANSAVGITGGQL